MSADPSTVPPVRLVPPLETVEGGPAPAATALEPDEKRISHTRVRAPLVLVAEDEPEAAALIEGILRREGCEVLVAGDGAQAFEMARELPRPDLVLLDLELPIMSGREFLDAMRADATLSGIPVIVVSAADDAATVRATDNVRKARLLDGLTRVLARLRGEMGEEATIATTG